MRSSTSGEVGQLQADAVSSQPARHHPYYEKYERGSDWLLRCKDCGRLVTYDQMFGPGKVGTTPCCATRSVREVRALSLWEWLKVRLGIIDFPHRDEFLKEFGFPLFGFKVLPPRSEQIMVRDYKNVLSAALPDDDGRDHAEDRYEEGGGDELVGR